MRSSLAHCLDAYKIAVRELVMLKERNDRSSAARATMQSIRLEGMVRVLDLSVAEQRRIENEVRAELSAAAPATG